jgi:hypothetical protein
VLNQELGRRKTLRKIYRDLQQELRFDSTAVPLLVGEVVRGEYGGICGHANPTINDIARHYPNTYVVSSEGCLPSDDNLHFSSEDYRQLGRRYALRYLETTNPQLAEMCRKKMKAARHGGKLHQMKRMGLKTVITLSLMAVYSIYASLGNRFFLRELPHCGTNKKLQKCQTALSIFI